MVPPVRWRPAFHLSPILAKAKIIPSLYTGGLLAAHGEAGGCMTYCTLTLKAKMRRSAGHACMVEGGCMAYCTLTLKIHGLARWTQSLSLTHVSLSTVTTT